MSELRKRATDPEQKESKEHAVDSDDEKLPEESQVDNLTKDLPQATDETTAVLDNYLSGLSRRWRNWVVRGIFTLLMMSFFAFVIWMGPLALMILTLAIQVKCFQEIIAIGYAVYRVHGLPWFRSLSWYFLLTTNYFLYGESLVDYFGVLISRTVLQQAVLDGLLVGTGPLWQNPLFDSTYNELHSLVIQVYQSVDSPGLIHNMWRTVVGSLASQEQDRSSDLLMYQALKASIWWYPA